MANLTFHLNGRPQTLDVDAAMPLLWVLRDVLGLTGTKFSCGMAQCGACTVLLDGKPMRSCVVAVSAAAGTHVTPPARRTSARSHTARPPAARTARGARETSC